MRNALMIHIVWFSILASMPHSGWAKDDPPTWTILPAHEIGAVAFRQQHETWDGRGVVLAILDTGVDPGVSGLMTTSTGHTKLIEARDFTDEGQWPLSLAEYEDGGWKHPKGLRLEGASQLPVPPKTDRPDYPVYMAVIAESDFQGNDEVADFTDDGDLDDRFGVLVYWADRSEVEEKLGLGRGLTFLAELNDRAAEEVTQLRASRGVWLVVPDTNGDGRLADEPQLRDYQVNWDTFSPAAADPSESRHMMTWTVQVTSPAAFSNAPPKLAFHFDSGAHGSHCAGIAAGYRVNGQDGLDGVAPGAWLMSLKIGDNNLSGGATRTESMKQAVQYAAEFGRRFDLPVVVNMSYGISSVEEEEDAISKIIEDVLKAHPNFYFCTSAGNEGPGLSSIGLPAASQHVISSGAFLPAESGRDLYEGAISRSTLFSFSSRGGETAKPDVIAPGTAMSTVPAYVDGSARFHGTSMASPQTAGAVACLVSAALDRGLKVHWGMIKRALILGGVPQEGLLLVEQGGGLVNIPNAWNVLEQLAGSQTAHQLLDYRIHTECPFQDDGQAPASYWRTLGGVPVAPQTVSFFVEPVFHPDMNADQRDAFFRSFDLRSDVPWLKPIARSRYIRGEMEMEIRVQYDAKLLDHSGVSCGRIIATQKGGDLNGLAAREFSLWNTVIVPTEFQASQAFMRVFEGKDLKPSTVDRYFLHVPPATSALQVLLELDDAPDGTSAAATVFNPEGAFKGTTGAAKPPTAQVKDFSLPTAELRSGIWEIDVVAGRENIAAVPYHLTVRIDGYSCEPKCMTDLAQAAPAEDAAAECRVTREFAGRFQGHAEAELTGFGSKETVTVTDDDTFVQSFALDRITPEVVWTLTMDEATANLFTDIAVLIEDDAGNVVKSGGFDGLTFEASVALPANTDREAFTLKLIGAFARKCDMDSWSFQLQRHFLFAEEISGVVTCRGDQTFNLYGGLAAPIEVSFPQTGPRPPQNMKTYGNVVFFDRMHCAETQQSKTAVPVFEVPIRLDR